MRVPLRPLSAVLLLVTGSSALAAPVASSGTTIRLEVPVVCQLVYRGEVVHQGNHYGLGQLHEYCNSPRGFVVQVEYQPGSLRGAVVLVGNEQITLDGSGRGEIMRSAGPKIATVNLTAIAARDDFDGSSLQFQIVPL